VSSVSYRLEDGTIKETMDRSSMDQCFIRANEAKIKQAQDTPFMVEPMVSEVGWLGIGPKVCQILEGMYDPPKGVDGATRLFIEQFRRNDKSKKEKRP
jgi:hypothetical protein